MEHHARGVHATVTLSVPGYKQDEPHMKVLDFVQCGGLITGGPMPAPFLAAIEVVSPPFPSGPWRTIPMAFISAPTMKSTFTWASRSCSRFEDT